MMPAELNTSYTELVKDYLYALPVNEVKDYKIIKKALTGLLHKQRLAVESPYKSHIEPLEIFLEFPERQCPCFPDAFREIVLYCIRTAVSKITCMSAEEKQKKVEGRFKKLEKLDPFFLENKEPTILRQCHKYSSQVELLLENGVTAEDIANQKPIARRFLLQTAETIVAAMSKNVLFSRVVCTIDQAAQLMKSGITQANLESLDLEMYDYVYANRQQFARLIKNGCEFDDLMALPESYLQRIINYGGRVAHFLKRGVTFETILHLDEELFEKIFGSHEACNLLKECVSITELKNLDESLRNFVIAHSREFCQLIKKQVSFVSLVSLRRERLEQVIEHTDRICCLPPIFRKLIILYADYINLLIEKGVNFNELINLKPSFVWEILYTRKIHALLEAGLKFKEIEPLDRRLRLCICGNAPQVAALIERGVSFERIISVESSCREKVIRNGDKIGHLMDTGVSFEQVWTDQNFLSRIQAGNELANLIKNGIPLERLMALPPMLEKKILASHEQVVALLAQGVCFENIVELESPLLDLVLKHGAGICRLRCCNPSLSWETMISFPDPLRSEVIQKSESLSLLMEQGVDLYDILSLDIEQRLLLYLNVKPIRALMRQGVSFSEITSTPKILNALKPIGKLLKAGIPIAKLLDLPYRYWKQMIKYPSGMVTLKKNGISWRKWRDTPPQKKILKYALPLVKIINYHKISLDELVNLDDFLFQMMMDNFPQLDFLIQKNISLERLKILSRSMQAMLLSPGFAEFFSEIKPEDPMLKEILASEMGELIEQGVDYWDIMQLNDQLFSKVLSHAILIAEKLKKGETFHNILQSKWLRDSKKRHSAEY